MASTRKAPDAGDNTAPSVEAAGAQRREGAAGSAARGAPIGPVNVLALQRLAGNQAVAGALQGRQDSTPVIQRGVEGADGPSPWQGHETIHESKPNKHGGTLEVLGGPIEVGEAGEAGDTVIHESAPNEQGGTLTVTQGDIELNVAEGPDAAARQLFTQLRDPGLAKERDELQVAVTDIVKNAAFVEGLIRKVTQADSARERAFHLGLRQISLLDLFLKRGTMRDAMNLHTVTGITEMIKGPITVVQSVLGVHSDVVHLAAKLTKNPRWIASAEWAVNAANKLQYLGLVSDICGTIQNVAKLTDDSLTGDKRVEAGVGAAKGAAGVAGGTAKIVEGVAEKALTKAVEAGDVVAAGKASASAAKWAARARMMTAVAVSVEINYIIVKWLAKNIYGKSLLAFTAAGLTPHYELLRADMIALAEAAYDLQHWTDVHAAADGGSAPESQALEEIRRCLPAVQRALRKLDEDTQAMPRPMRDAFRSNSALRMSWKLGTEDPAFDPIFQAQMALEAADGAFAVGDHLFKNYETVLREFARERADQFHGRQD